VSDRTTSTKTAGFRLRRGAVALAGVLALGLAACGDDGGSGTASPSVGASQGSESGVSPLKAVELAAQTSQQKSTAAFTMDMDMTMGAQQLPMKATGQIDGAKNALKLDISMSIPGQGAMKLKEVVVGKTIYMSGIPGTPASQWVKLSLEELGAAAGGVNPSLGSGTDPTDQLALLNQVSDDVKQVGKETVNGVETTKYSGTIDLDKAAAASGADAKQLAEVRKQYKQLGLSKIPFSLYVDGENLPARMEMSMNGKVTSAGKTETMKMTSTMNFTNWGDPVTITAPKKAVSFEELLQGLGAGLGGTTP
jgi:hypothetical protein